jgi:hypothetical protein
MKTLRPFIVTALLIFAAVGCTSNFLITKNGKSYFFGSRDDATYKMLCESGDLKMILSYTKLPESTKADIYKYNCTAPSKDKLKEVVSSMTPEQRRELRLSFQIHGYDINRINC